MTSDSNSQPLYIITGASRGIGRFLLNTFRLEGQKVLGIYNATEPEEHAEYCHRLDITQLDKVREFLVARQDSLRNIVLLNAAGISYNAFAHKTDIDNWSQVIQTNLVALANLTNLLLPTMRENGFGRVINFGSVVAQTGVVGTSAYAASKSGLWGFSRALAVENANKGITVNTINLGYFNIGIIEQVPASMLDGIIQKIPAKRLGQPNEILNTVRYIIDTPYLNGASIDLNGGMY